MSLEARVGAFVVAGLALMGTAIFLLGNYTLEKRYVVNVDFSDVANLTKNSPVKLSGVDVGQVTDISLVDSHAKVVCSIRDGVKIYRDATFTIGSTGIIGSKYLQIDQGHESAGLVEPGDTVEGTAPVDIQKALTQALGSLQKTLDQLNTDTGRGTLADNLKNTVANVREMTANLNDLIATTKPDLEKAMGRADDITKKLDDLLAQSNQMMTGLATSQGAVGTLLHDPVVKEQLKQTIADVKDAAATAKDTLSRINQFRVYWNYDWRYETAIHTARSDIGLKIVPRDGHYYYGGLENLSNPSDAPVSNKDYEQPNKVDGLLGFFSPWYDLGVGAIRSAGGARLTLTPFYQDPIGKRFSFMVQAYDFGRNRTVDSKLLNKPEYDMGLIAHINRFFGIGGRVEDLAEASRFETWLNVSFEDKDIAYLFGLATFGAAGTKGRSKNSSDP